MTTIRSFAVGFQLLQLVGQGLERLHQVVADEHHQVVGPQTGRRRRRIGPHLFDVRGRPLQHVGHHDHAQPGQIDALARAAGERLFVGDGVRFAGDDLVDAVAN